MGKHDKQFMKASYKDNEYTKTLKSKKDIKKLIDSDV